MAGNLQLYTSVYVYVDGNLLTEHASVKIARKSNAQVSNSVFKGFSGMSTGAPIMEISFESNFPATGIEYDVGPLLAALRPVELTLVAANRTLTTKGFWTDDDLGHGVNAESKMNANGMFQMAQWE